MNPLQSWYSQVTVQGVGSCQIYTWDSESGWAQGGLRDEEAGLGWVLRLSAALPRSQTGWEWRWRLLVVASSPAGLPPTKLAAEEVLTTR